MESFGVFTEKRWHQPSIWMLANEEDSVTAHLNNFHTAAWLNSIIASNPNLFRRS
jgi:hypothetical protein